MSHYEAACKKACKWCATALDTANHVGVAGVTRKHFTNLHYYPESKGYEDCTAPTLEAWAEQQAELVKELLEALREARAWIPDGTGRSAAKKGARRETLFEALAMIVDTIARAERKGEPELGGGV